MTEKLQPRWFLSTAPATSGERTAAIAVVAISFLAFLATVPFVKTPLARLPAFIPAYQSALFIIDLITAVILFGQFARLRSRAILALAAGYLFDAAMIIPHTLSFPGVFAPTGLITAGEQTTAWLYVFWHGGFPLFVLAYVYFRSHPSDILTGDARPALFGTIATSLVLAFAFALLATAGHDLLPRIMRGGDYSLLVTTGISPAVWLLTLTALIVVWRRKHTVLDLWLMVVMAVWLLDIALSAILGSARFDLGFYAGRLYGLIAASIVLIALLIEMVRLYGHLTDALHLSEKRNEELVRTREAVAGAQRMEAIGQITGGIAHDFNNLFTVICGNLELIGKAPANAERVERMAQRAMSAAKRGNRLTRQLLTFGGRHINRAATVDPNRLILDFEPLLERAAEGMEIMTGLSSSVHPVDMDVMQFETAILNLIGNARDATGGSGRIIIETRNVTLDAAQIGPGSVTRPGDHVLVTVRDTGPGMPAEVASRAFEPFFTTKDSRKGAGLGLSQVYGFVRGAGGHVSLDTQPGRGTSVHLYFPKSDKPPAVEPKPDTPAAPRRGAGETILVVEDDPDVREVTLAALADMGYRVQGAAHAEEALSILRSDAPVDLLFSDIVMPGGINGMALAAEARRIRSRLKVLLTSGHAGVVDQREYDAGLDILEKPYPHDELASRLRRAMAG